MTIQGTVEASTWEGVDASLLAQQLYGRLASADSLRTSVRVRLACIPSTDEALCDFGTFVFVKSHFFSTVGRHPSAVAELLRLIERLEELHTEVQGMTTFPHLATTLLYDVSRLWSLYLNRCVKLLSSEKVGATGATVPFSLKPILLELESGRYVGPLLPLPLTELVSGRHGDGGGNDGGGSGGNRKCGKGEGHGSCGGGGYGSGSGYVGKSRGAVWGGASGKGGGARSTVRVRARYDAHLPAMSLRDGENSRTILAGAVLPTQSAQVPALENNVIL